MNLEVVHFKQHLSQYLSRSEFQESTVVFSGGIAVKQSDRLLTACDELKLHLPVAEAVDFKIVTRGELSGAYGAVALLRDDCFVQ